MNPGHYTNRVSHTWNPTLYQSSYSFVFERGKEVLALLQPQAGERILDIGCGTGQLTAEIARTGAWVMGVDASSDMVAQARANFPEIRFEVQDVCDLPFHGEFDAVFSNAVLHWVKRAEAAAAGISRALKPGGRFVAEFGGHGNIRALMAASDRAMRTLRVSEPDQFHPWFYPSIAEYSTILEQHGLEVSFAHLFDRPTPLEGGEDAIPTFLRMFGSSLVTPLREEQIPVYYRLTREFAAPELCTPEGWMADYRRLRIAARKTV